MNYELFQHPEKKIYLIDMTKEIEPVFSELLKNGLKKYIAANKKIGILINRKGFDGGMICHRCGHIPQCDRCSVAINYYLLPSGEKMGICHICKKQYPFPTSCANCGSNQIKEYGLGAQKLAQLLKEDYQVESAIVSSDTVRSPSKFAKFTQQLQEQQQEKGKNPILIGTSLLTTPMKGWDLDLVVFLNADIGLNIPDYNAAEKNFYFLYEAFAKHPSKTFLVQTLNPAHHSIRSACRMDEKGFFEQENPFRKQYGYPPYGEICVLLYKDEIEEKVFKKVDQLYKELLYLQQKYQVPELEIYTTPPMIYKIFGKYRYNIILKGPQLRNFMDIIFPKLQLYKKGFKVDRMAESIV